MTKEPYTIDGIQYSMVDGCYHKTFKHNKVTYEAVLAPFAMVGSACTISRITDTDDPNNITAPVDERTVYYKRFSTFKSSNLHETVNEFTELLLI